MHRFGYETVSVIRWLWDKSEAEYWYRMGRKKNWKRTHLQGVKKIVATEDLDYERSFWLFF